MFTREILHSEINGSVQKSLFPEDFIDDQKTNASSTFQFCYATVGSMLIDHFGSLVKVGDVTLENLSDNVSSNNGTNTFTDANFDTLLKTNDVGQNSLKTANISIGQKIYTYDYGSPNSDRTSSSNPKKSGIPLGMSNVTSKYKEVELPTTTLTINDYKHYYNDLFYSGKPHDSNGTRTILKIGTDDNRTLSDVIIKPWLGYWVLVNSSKQIQYNKSISLNVNTVTGNGVDFVSATYMNNLKQTYQINTDKAA